MTRLELAAELRRIALHGVWNDEVTTVRTVLRFAADQLEADGEDTEHLDWLEQKGMLTQDIPGIQSWVDSNGVKRWTAHRISSEFTTIRAAIKAARKGDK